MPRRRDVMKFAGLNLLAGIGVASAAPKVPTATVSMDQAKLSKPAFGEERIYFDGETDQLKAMTVGSQLHKPGATPEAAHKHPEEEIILVTQGTGEVTLDGKIVKVGPGSVTYVAGGKMHGVKNTGKTPFQYYFYLWRV